MRCVAFPFRTISVVIRVASICSSPTPTLFTMCCIVRMCDSSSARRLTGILGGEAHHYSILDMTGQDRTEQGWMVWYGIVWYGGYYGTVLFYEDDEDDIR